MSYNKEDLKGCSLGITVLAGIGLILYCIGQAVHETHRQTSDILAIFTAIIFVIGLFAYFLYKRSEKEKK